MNKTNHEDFYIVCFDAKNNIIYPKEENEVNYIKNMLNNVNSDNYVILDNGQCCYKVRTKLNNKYKIVELSNVTEFVNRIHEASIDEITNLSTRKVAKNLFMQYIDIAYQNKEDFSIIISDLDYFKSINDTYGHINGDNVLKEVSKILSSSTGHDQNRTQDIVARIGGDEFIIIMKNVSEEISFSRAELIRSKVESKKILLQEGDSTINIGSLSIGVYHVTYDELSELFFQGYTTEEIRAILLCRCDSALYLSKNNGKNKVTIYSKEKCHCNKKTTECFQ